MKRNILLVLLLFFAIVFAYGQNASPIDLVLLLDTSSTMSSSYDNVNNYVTGAFLNEFLRVGDTFHLISFSANPKLDVARRISGLGDVETIIGRILLQYPVENGSNISSALNFAEQYINTLPSRPKKIVLVSVGGADTANAVNASKQRLNAKNTTLDFIQVTPGSAITNAPKSGRPAGTNITTGTTAAASSGGTSAGTSGQGQQGTAGTSTASQGTGRTTTGTTGTTSTGTTGTGSTAGGAGTTTTPGGTTTAQGAGAGSTTQQQSGGKTSGGTSSGGTTAGGTSSDGTPYGGTSTDGTSYGGTSADGTSTDGTSADGKSTDGTSDGAAKKYLTPEERARRSESYYTSMPFIILVVILLLLLLGIIIFRASRKLGSRPNRIMAEVAAGPHQTEESRSPNPRDHVNFVDHSKDLAKYASAQGRRSTPYDSHPLKPDTYKAPVINPSGPLLLNLFVEDQNTRIGKRNIHSLKSGYSLSVGGSKSDDYYVFLVPVPGHLGDIRRDGSSLTFIPRKGKYFPDIGTNPVNDCINKTIRIISDKKYEMRFRFEMYEDPLIALNRTLMSVKVPG